MPTPLTVDEIRQAPKVVLHDHLDGGLRPATIIELADDNGYELPTKDPDELSEWIRGAPTGRPRALPRDVRAHRRRHAVARLTRARGRANVRRTWRPTASCTPRCASHPSSTSRRASRSTKSSKRCSGASGRRGRSPITVATRCAPRCARRRAPLEIAELAVRWRDEGVSGSTSPAPRRLSADPSPRRLSTRAAQ